MIKIIRQIFEKLKITKPKYKILYPKIRNLNMLKLSTSIKNFD